jgi:pimeloyl-ACP methyl ester carboxylesterase
MSDYTSLISEFQPWAEECDKLVVETTHGVLCGVSRGKGEPAILCIHGNSFCMGIFEHIVMNTKGHQVVAFDLPGHGSSSDAVGK